MTIFALGFFDGVHLGHAALLRSCREMAGQRGMQAGVVTFAAHPDELVMGAAPGLINAPEDRTWLLTQSYGMERVVVLPFDRQMRAMPWREFLEMLRREQGAGGFVCGQDFRFGYQGQGSAELLTQYCQEARLPWSVVPEQRMDGVRVSSTRIREMLAAGDIEQANRFLGHPHMLRGRVLHGKALGRRLGIPTANLPMPAGVAVPRLGVYVCGATVDGVRYPAVTNVGTRPTVEGSGINVESWLLGFDGDLYGKELLLEFYRFLRPERRFESLEEMQQQIGKNAQEAREYWKKQGWK